MSWRIYLVGAGAIAHQHAIAARALGDVDLHAADPSPAAREAFVAAFPEAAIYADPQEMLGSSPAAERDIVILAVPPWLHHQAGMAAFQSGRHVLSEKPVVRSLAELDDLIAASRKADRLLGDCSVRFLGQGALERARALIAAGSIGTPYHARLVNRRPRSRPGVEYQPQSRWFLDREKSGGGSIFDWGVYDLTAFFDVVQPVSARIETAWLATPTTAVDPPDHPITVETHAGAAMTLELADGATVAFEFERGNGMHGDAQSLLNVDGTRGGLSWDWTPPFESDVPTLKHHSDVDGKLVTEVERFPTFGWEAVHARPLLAFADLVAGRPSVTLTLARLRFNFAVLAGIYEAAAHGHPVEVVLGT